MTVRVTWWGHATAVLELGGATLLTDPLLTARLAHLRRLGSPVPPPARLRADGVLVSHLHPDHLHLPSLRRLPDPGTLVLPAGGAALAAPAWGGGTVKEVEAGTVVQVGDRVQVQAVPAAHDGRRLPGSRHRGPALGYLITSGSTRVWFAGDTGLFDAMADLGPVDVAVLPVGGWGPTLGPHHLDPEEAAEAAARVQARHAVPVHYGTFWPVGLRRVAPAGFERLFRAPGARFAAAVAARGSATQVHVLRSGESVTLDG